MSCHGNHASHRPNKFVSEDKFYIHKKCPVGARYIKLDTGICLSCCQYILNEVNS